MLETLSNSLQLLCLYQPRMPTSKAPEIDITISAQQNLPITQEQHK